MFKVTSIAIRIIENFDEFIFALFSRLLPWGVAAGPALILGFTASKWATGAGIPEDDARWVGAAIAIAIVVAGAVNAHLAIKYAEAWILVILTIGLEILGLFLTGSDSMPWVGTVASLIQGAVYVGRAWSAKDKRDEEKLEEEKKLAADREWELKLRQQDNNLKVRLAKVEAKKVSNTVQKVSIDNSLDTAQNPSNQAEGNQNGRKNLSKEDKLYEMIDIYLTTPRAGVSTVARQLDVSRQTVYNYLDELEKEGKITKNGQGVIVK